MSAAHPSPAHPQQSTPNHRPHRCRAGGIRFFLSLIISVMVSLVGQIADAADPRDILVQQLSGETRPGKLIDLNDTDLFLAEQGNTLEIPRSSISKLTIAENKVDPAPIEVLLVDDSRLRSESLTMQNDEWTLDDYFADPILPPRQVKSVLFRTPTSEELQDWNRILRSERTNDSLVIARSSGAVDQIDGLVLSVDESSVEFDFDGQVISAPRDKLLGLVLFRQIGDRLQPAPTVQLTNGSQIQASKIEWSSDANELSLKTATDVVFKQPLSKLAEIDFGSANLRWLADLQVLDRQLTSDVVGAVGGDGFGVRELLLPGFVSSGTSKGTPSAADSDLSFSMPGEYTLRVPEGFSRFAAKVKRNVRGDLKSPLTIEIRQAGRVLFSEQLTDKLDGMDLKIDVEPDKQITLVVACSNTLPVGTATLWLQPRFSR
jgi:hypothetical protein